MYPCCNKMYKASLYQKSLKALPAPGSAQVYTITAGEFGGSQGAHWESILFARSGHAWSSRRPNNVQEGCGDNVCRLSLRSRPTLHAEGTCRLHQTTTNTEFNHPLSALPALARDVTSYFLCAETF